MSENSKIEWTDSTWNPLVAYRGEKRGWHCEKITPACDNCYAASMNKRSDGLVGIGTGLPYAPDQRAKLRFEVHEPTLLAPLKWRKPRKIFVCSMTDLFGDWWTDEQILRVIAVASQTPEHTYQFLTKRPARAIEILGHPKIEEYVDRVGRMNGWCHSNAEGRFPLPNVWLGVTAENQEQADARISLLLETPAAKRFVSIEPMLGEVDLTNLTVPTANGPEQWDGLDKLDAADAEPGTTSATLDWVIAGGESGPKARPSHPDWFRSLRNQCQASGVPFFFKQWGELNEHQFRVGKKAAGRLLDGVEWSQFPKGGAA